jgi:trehalose 6-phosphate phosphatase
VPKNILADRNTEHLRTVVGGGSLLAFDFDGTLAVLGDDPTTTRMRPETAELLRSLAHAAPVAIVTGRSVSDAMLRLEGIPLLGVVGNHGIEPSPFAVKAARAVTKWMPLLDGAFSEMPGVWIENKGFSVSVHYRLASDHAAASAAVARLVPNLPGKVRMVQGNQLINLVPDGAPNKGDAVRELIATHALPGAVYVGDEPTDEDAFAVLDGAASMGVRVGRSSASAAPFYIASQMEIDALLAEMIVGRTRPNGASRADHPPILLSAG